MASKGSTQLLVQLTVSFWLLLLCVLIFLIPRSNIFELSLPKLQNPFSQKSILSSNNGSQQTPTTENGDHQTPTTESKYPFLKALQTADNTSDPCGGRYIYIQPLPPRFNADMLVDCDSLDFPVRGTKMCVFVQNDGFGPAFDKSEDVYSEGGWYETNQFSLDLIFHHRIKRYDCLTNDSSLAAAIYIPFYAGYDISRNSYAFKSFQVRDAMPFDLIDWLKNTSQWGVMGGKDHFIVAGRVTWEFRRLRDDDYGNKLLLLPEMQNVSTLLIESSPWSSNDYAIPYPSYFHPSKNSDLFFWQNRLRKLKREWLYSFAGSAIPGNIVRNKAYDECKNSKVCNLFHCPHANEICSGKDVMRVFENSHFCLQPPGDTPTRRSTFDSMLAGCIPVFFHPAAAYVQYTWHLPKKYSSYSVFISEVEIREKNISIEETLRQIPSQRVEEMQERVIDLIPSLLYGDPRSKLWTFKDAVDLALEGVIRKVTKLRRNIIDGRSRPEGFNENLSWKYALLDKDEAAPPEELGPHEWDHFFN